MTMTAKIEALFTEMQATLKGMREDNEASNRRKEAMQKNILNVDDVAALLGKTRDYVKNLARTQMVPSYRQGNSIFFKREELEAWQTRHRTASLDEIHSLGATYCATRRLNK